MTPATVLTYDGVTQPISEWALDYGILTAVIIARLERGLSVERAITKPMVTAPGQKLIAHKRPAQTLPNRKPNERYAFNGKSLTMSEWATEIGISRSALLRRLQRWPLERALTEPVGNGKSSEEAIRRAPPTPMRYLFRGQRLTVKEITALTGWSGNSVRRRIRGDIVADIVADIPFTTVRTKPRLYLFRGRWLPVKEIAATAGVAEQTIYKWRRGERIAEYEERRIERKPRRDSTVLTYEGVTDHLPGWSRRTGIPSCTLFARYHCYGWSVERTLTEPVMDRGQRRALSEVGRS